MPEGDTILRAARKLALHLDGRALTDASSPPALARRTVTRVEARGKNLFVHFEDGRALRTHLGMHGSWHVYAPGERWTRPRHLARAVLATDAAVCVCFAAPVVELTASQKAQGDALGLGPDILAETFDEPEALRRLRARGELPVGEALLAQSLVAGIGNIYKSETLFLERVSPFAKVADLDDATLRRVLARARLLMRRNLAPAAARRTTAAAARGIGSYHVYKRSGLPCPRCGARIAMERQGHVRPREVGRSTYYCPTCQA